MKKKIKLFDPNIGREELKKISQVLKSKFWASGSGIGNVLKFENRFKKYIGSDECIAVNSGTAALNLSLSLLEIKNKEVILPSLSFVSTAHAVKLNGGIPVFADIDEKSLSIDPDQIKKLISKKTAVILPVHFGGFPCNLKDIQDIAEKHNLTVIEDAAHAAGATYNHKKIGNHGTAVCFSFHPVKNLAMPTGGLISINHENHKQFRKMLLARRWCGISDRRGSEYDVKELGWNYYMNEFSAVIGLAQLKKLDRSNNARRNIAKRYYDEIQLEQKMPFNLGCSYHFYWVMIKKRDKLIKKLKKDGIETGIHYKPIHKLSMYNSKSKLPITENAGKKIISLPTHPNLSDKDVTRIISFVNN